MTTVYNPLQWVTSLQRSLRDYLSAEIDTMISGGGLNVYDVTWDYPPSAAPAPEIDMSKTIIHMEIDDIENIKLGFGTDIVAADYTPGNVSTPATLVEKEARCHRVNFDVGVWASDLSGGSSSRLLTYEVLDRAFGGELARKKCMSVTQGVEILIFEGGRFLVDTINDVRVFRIVDCTLIVRVYSRKDGSDLIVADSITQDQLLTIPPLAIIE